MLIRPLNFLLPEGQRSPGQQYEIYSAHGVSRGALVELTESQPFANQSLCLVVPAELCALKVQAFTPQEKKLLSKTIPYMFEEELIDKVEDVHFAQGKALNGSVVVGLINKNIMRVLLEDFASVEQPLETVIPELSLLPWQAEQWTLLIETTAANNRCLLRYKLDGWLSCSLENLKTLLTLLLNDGEHAPKTFQIYLDADDLDSVRIQIPEPLQASIKVERKTYWQVMDVENSKELAPDLLQGDFISPLPWQSWWKQWRIAALLLMAVAVAEFGMSFTQLQTLQNQNTAMSEEIENLYRSVIPQGVIADAQLQLQRRVNSLEGVSGNGGFMALLMQIAPTVSKRAGSEIQSLEFNDSNAAIGLVLMTDSFGEAEAIRAELESLGLKAELIGSASAGNRSRSRLRVGG